MDKNGEVWVVDDSPALFSILKSKSKNSPYEIVSISTADEAALRLKNSRPLFVVSDYNIVGDGDGMNVAKIAKENNIPVALVSATESVKNSADKIGVDFFHKKTGYVDELVKHINSCLGHCSSMQNNSIGMVR